jgi:arylsulfatase A-like enzyme
MGRDILREMKQGKTPASAGAQGHRLSHPGHAVIAGTALGFCYLYRIYIAYRVDTAWGGRPSAVWLAKHGLLTLGGDAATILGLLSAALLGSRVSVRLGRAVLAIGLGVVILAATLNVKFVQIYSQPATLGIVELFRLDQVNNFVALRRYVDGADVLITAIGLSFMLVLLLLPRVFCAIETGWPLAVRRAGQVSFLAIAASVCALAFPASAESSLRSSNAAYWFARSLVFTEDNLVPRIERAEIAPVLQTVPAAALARRPLGASRAAPIRNVILIVLESVGARHLDLDRDPGLTPHLAALRPMSAYFPNTYVTMPSSEQSMIGILASSYIPVVPDTMPDAEPDMPLPSLPSVLGNQGWRTYAVLSDIGNWSVPTLHFLCAHGFQRVETHATPVSCSDGRRRAAAAPPDPEGVSFRQLRDWIESGGSQPFFAMLWTFRTHAPYTDDGAMTSYAAIDDMRRAYRAQIAASDREVGDLVGWLARRGQLDDTLIVVTGDHGEAFREHGTEGHGADVFEETVRTPLLLVNARLFAGVTDRGRIGEIDIAPTVLALMGLPRPAAFQGVALTEPRRRRRTYFAVPWGDLALGYVEGDRKAVYHVISQQLQIHDLSRDPMERTDLAPAMPKPQRGAIVYDLFNFKNAIDRLFAARGMRED